MFQISNDPPPIPAADPAEARFLSSLTQSHRTVLILQAILAAALGIISLLRGDLTSSAIGGALIATSLFAILQYRSNLRASTILHRLSNDLPPHEDSAKPQ